MEAMLPNRSMRSVVGCRIVGCLAAGLLAALAHAGDAEVNSAGNLRAKYAELRIRLSNNQFQKPLYLNSSESQDGVTGEIYALIDHPFATAAAALNSPGDWCEILILHINTKYCRASMGGQGSVLNVSIGKKYDQPLDQAYRVEFAYRVAAQTSDYLQVRLNADQGPLSTRNYRIELEAVPLDNGRTFIHLSYSYAFGRMGRLAMQVYLGTVGSGKVGFTVAGTQTDGQPLHIGGMRGVVERNTMRYYLAIEAFLGALSAPPQARLEKRLRDWFAAAERYPRQLHEMEQGEYLDMKRKEYLRQQAGLLPRLTFPQEAAHVQDAGTG
ncbi:MAG TPA: hypothetical protein VGQ88_03565 [Burkholderiales bacterium]|nr:hypothetical protein [Burkholderiales bacterium]